VPPGREYPLYAVGTRAWLRRHRPGGAR
jgi:hypothetical protein